MGARIPENDEILTARLKDAMRTAGTGNRTAFVGFLDERQAGIARKAAAGARFDHFLLWGGFGEAERTFFGAFPDFMEPREADFPICGLTVSYRAEDRLSHRDFLGAFLSQGVERSALGDILAQDGRCVCFCRSGIAGFLCAQVRKIGGAGVKISEGFSEPLPKGTRFEAFSAVAASARLDCAVAAASGVGRSKAAEMIRCALVAVNHETVISPCALVRENDTVSVRGEGRFIFDRLGPATKKGRLNIAGRKYI
jgi:RNA-binding protein YlmH